MIPIVANPQPRSKKLSAAPLLCVRLPLNQKFHHRFPKTPKPKFPAKIRANPSPILPEICVKHPALNPAPKKHLRLCVSPLNQMLQP